MHLSFLICLSQHNLVPLSPFCNRAYRCYRGAYRDYKILLDNKQNLHGRTHLHQAIERGHEQVARVLLGYGANVNAKDSKDATPLHCTTFSEDLTLAELCIDYSAELDAKDQKGNTTLQAVISTGNIGMAICLVTRGADVNTMDKDANTPLHMAAYKGDVEMALLLLDHQADPNAQDKNVHTPLNMVIMGEKLHEGNWESYQKIIDPLIDYWADVNLQANMITHLFI